MSHARSNQFNHNKERRGSKKERKRGNWRCFLYTLYVTYSLEYNFIIAEEYFPGNSRDDGNEYSEADDSSYNDEDDDENSSSNSNLYDKVRYMPICIAHDG